jgi:hypothetical protein
MAEQVTPIIQHEDDFLLGNQLSFVNVLKLKTWANSVVI